ncbi:hypothetical protein A4X13_0g8771 [Tilletia indica]|uniref:Uncharacterized protein n=1 Tax=Tilletia indica TaxID=43049 RepID=A0A177T2B7_9BASI|nr:hypothetical protein A4X13_0g8771 [Tilletia indica]
MWFHLHLIPLQQGTQIPTASWPAYEEGHFYAELDSQPSNNHSPPSAPQQLRIKFRNGTFFARQDSADRVLRINSAPVPALQDVPLLQSDLIELGRAPCDKYNRAFTCRVDLSCSTSAAPDFPGPFTHTASRIQVSYAWIDDIGRALDDSARHYGYLTPCPPLRPAAFKFTDCTVITTSALPRREDAPLPAFFPHVPTSTSSTPTPSYEVTIGFAPSADSSSASSTQVLAPPSSRPSTPPLTASSLLRSLSPSPPPAFLSTPSKSRSGTSVLTSPSTSPRRSASRATTSSCPATPSSSESSPTDEATLKLDSFSATSSGPNITSILRFPSVTAAKLPSSTCEGVSFSPPSSLSAPKPVTASDFPDDLPLALSHCSSVSASDSDRTATEARSFVADCPGSVPYGQLLPILRSRSASRETPSSPSAAPTGLHTSSAQHAPPSPLSTLRDRASPLNLNSVDTAIRRVSQAWITLRHHYLSGPVVPRRISPSRASSGVVPPQPQRPLPATSVRSLSSAELALSRVGAALQDCLVARAEEEHIRGTQIDIRCSEILSGDGCRPVVVSVDGTTAVSSPRSRRDLSDSPVVFGSLHSPSSVPSRTRSCLRALPSVTGLFLQSGLFAIPPPLRVLLFPLATISAPLTCQRPLLH